jgi:hypothetical protein
MSRRAFHAERHRASHEAPFRSCLDAVVGAELVETPAKDDQRNRSAAARASASCELQQRPLAPSSSLGTVDNAQVERPDRSAATHAALASRVRDLRGGVVWLGGGVIDELAYDVGPPLFQGEAPPERRQVVVRGLWGRRPTPRSGEATGTCPPKHRAWGSRPSSDAGSSRSSALRRTTPGCPQTRTSAPRSWPMWSGAAGSPWASPAGADVVEHAPFPAGLGEAPPCRPEPPARVSRRSSPGPRARPSPRAARPRRAWRRSSGARRGPRTGRIDRRRTGSRPAARPWPSR